jgi:hypothetical protein
MRTFWEEPLTEEQKLELIESMAVNIVKRGLGTPAVMFLEMNKPLTTIASSTAIVASPFLVPFLGFDRIDQYTQFFQARENVERLIERIEEMEEEKRLSKKNKEEPLKE